MKHLNITFLLFLFMGMMSIEANAYDCYIDGIYYNLNSSYKTASVTSQEFYWENNKNAYTGSVSIPLSITYNGEKYSVKSIGNFAFAYCTGLTSMTIPNSITSIGESIFI